MTKLNMPATFEDADRMLGTRDVLKIGHNTYLRREGVILPKVGDGVPREPGHGIAVVYHSSVVVSFFPGLVRLFTNGYHTTTTAVRLRAWLALHNFGLSSEGGDWKIHDFRSEYPFDFEEGFNFDVDEYGLARVGA